MKKLFALVFVALVLLSCGKKETDTVNIGVILPLSGDIAVYGNKMKNAFDLYVSQLNRTGGLNGQSVKLIYEDDKAEAKTSVMAFNKLVSSNKCKVILGGAISSTALSIAELAQKNKVILFSPSATSPKLTGISKYFFRNWPSDSYDGLAMAEFSVNKLNYKKIAILFVNNDWGVAISNVFKDKFESLGGKIVAEESFLPETRDFRSQILKIKRANPEAIYIPAYQKELINIINQLKQLGNKARILSSYGFYDPEILKETKTNCEGAIFTVPAFNENDTSKVLQEFINNYKAKYGQSPDIWSAQAYDAIDIVVQAIKHEGMNVDLIRKYILSLKDFHGVSGLTTFDNNGDVSKPLRFFTVKNNSFVSY